MTTKTEYAAIEKEMKLWRKGLIGLPKSYIQYHADLAKAAQKDLTDAGIEIHKEMMRNDGWMDGMQTLHIIIEMPDGKLKMLKWTDANSSGHWMEKLECGWGSFSNFHLQKNEGGN